MKYGIMFRAGRIHPAKMIISLFTAVLFFVTSYVSGQEASDADPELAGTTIQRAPVKVDGVTLFSVRGVSTFPAETRASAISKRIISAAVDPSISADSVKVMVSKDKHMIFAGKRFIMNIYEVDASNERIQASILAELIKLKTRSAIITYRHERSQPVLVKKSLYAAGATLLMILILLAFKWLIRKADIFLQNRIRTKLDIVDIKSFNLIKSAQLWKAYLLFFKLLRISIIILIFAIFIQYILGLFPWTNSVAVYTLGLFVKPVLSMGRSFVQYLPSLAFLIVIFIVTRYLLKLIRLLFSGIEHGAIEWKGFSSEWALPTYKIIRIFIIAFSIIIAYPYIPGSETSAFKGVSVFIGILFSLGSSSFLGNVIAGYSMTYRRAFKKGDRIKVDDTVGFVEEQKLLVTRLRSIKNEEIVIPNSILLNSNITNYSTKEKEMGVILHTTVGIGYETPWRQVDAMLLLAASRTEGLLKDPQPYVLKKLLGDFAITYEINAYCSDATQMNQLYSVLHENILDIFNENNVQIMTPAYEGDPEVPKVVPRDQWDIPLARS